MAKNVNTNTSNMGTGIELIKKERQEQLGKHGWSLEHDKTYTGGQLVGAALFCIEQFKHPSTPICNWPNGWGLRFKYKIIHKSDIDKLCVAGAFYMAEQDRAGTSYSFEIKMVAKIIDNLLKIK